MTYDELPLIPIEVTRTNGKKKVFRNITVNGLPWDLTTARVKVGFKSTVDAKRYYDFELTEENGGLEIEPSQITLDFEGKTQGLEKSVYYGDILTWLNDTWVTILRLELKLSGVVTTPTNNCAS